MCKRGDAFSLPVLIARSNLIALIFNAHWTTKVARPMSHPITTSLRGSPRQDESLTVPVMRPPLSVLRRPGGISGEPEPDAIPNSAVKLPSADGTKSQDLEE